MIKKLLSNKWIRSIKALWLDFWATNVQTLVSLWSDHSSTIVQVSCDLWSDYSATLPSDQTLVQSFLRTFPRHCALIRPYCDHCPDHFPDFALWSDRIAAVVQTISQTLPSDQTLERALSRTFHRLCPVIRLYCYHCPDHFTDFALWSDRIATTN